MLSYLTAMLKINIGFTIHTTNNFMVFPTLNLLQSCHKNSASFNGSKERQVLIVELKLTTNSSVEHCFTELLRDSA